MDLFGDLPDPGSGQKVDSSYSATAIDLSVTSSSSNVTTANVIEERGEKRKSVDDGTDSSKDKKNRIENQVECEGNQTQDNVFKMKGFVADRQGEREEMQDAHIIIDNYRPLLQNVHPSIRNLSLYCVFDGHGGARASRFASQHLHSNLRDRFPKGDACQVEKEIKKTFVEAFKKTDEDFLKEATKNKPSWKDGSTAVSVLAINNTLYIANLGDSKAVLCRYKESEGKYVGVSLTSDHSPSVYVERMRIQKAGGWVRDGRVMGQLEVARSIGDGPYKNHGVTSVPDIKRCQLTDNDRFVIIACDGLWKSFTVDESVQFVNNYLQDKKKKIEGQSKNVSEEVRFETACSKLANSAVLKLSGDNVTVLLVSIHKDAVKT